MIEIIIYEALSWDGLEIDGSGVSLEEIVSDILNVCEKRGMLPPMQPIPIYSISAPNEWEKE